jgi:hypothetical protein
MKGVLVGSECLVEGNMDGGNATSKVQCENSRYQKKNLELRAKRFLEK